MTRVQKQLVMLGLLVTLAAAGALWSLSDMLARRGDARYALADLNTSRELVARIEQLRDEPSIAAAEDVGVQQLSARIEAALRTAGISTGNIEGIYPQQERPLGQLPYQVKPTSLTLRSVTLPQYVNFLYHLTENPGLNVRDIQLRQPSAAGNNALWDTDTTLTYLIYTPQEPTP
ncbi:hypothetical protein [Mucisphaera calidilacus]|uniref:Uncharacterized protein n=1 Tax=Mucisphaera calidilacus TaxID=2527982 RepID=A0A518BUE8_9BACT|nr:hypothetical protein [Mucisphaera calidilacus]QDU70615.1 hypothetical protein Pan265_04430 [Mucisphaera calidilacus]